VIKIFLGKEKRITKLKLKTKTMAFKLPQSPFNLTDPKDKKIKPFVDPGAPEGFEKGLWSKSTESVIRPYEGKAFVGTTGGGKRQPVGKTVTGVTESGRSSEDKFVKGTVQPKSLIGSSSSSVVKGATIEQPKYKKTKREVKSGSKKA